MLFSDGGPSATSPNQAGQVAGPDSEHKTITDLKKETESVALGDRQGLPAKPTKAWVFEVKSKKKEKNTENI